MLNKFIKICTLLFSMIGIVSVPAVAFAAVTPNLTQTINAGVLTTDILDSSRNPVASPAAAMAAADFSFNCQTSTGSLGTNAQRLYVSNGKGDGAGWTLAMAATDGAAAQWENNGATKSYDYNDATGSGCTNGQLTIDPSAGAVTADCTSSGCNSATVTKGTSTAMTAATPVTLMTGGVDADVYRGYVTGVGLSQKIPAEQSPDAYSMGMTLTVTAS